MTDIITANGSMTSVPSPISWQPSGNWIGNDGNWSSFALRAGSPFQKFEVLISTKSTFTLLVDPVGCEPSELTAENCPFYRGGIFNSNKSTTWQYAGSFQLTFEENLGPRFDDSPNFGFEKVSLGSSNTTGGPTLASQVVGTYGINAFYNGLFGLNNQPTNFTSLTDSHPSFISMLLSERLIPSLSWSFNAGAYYRGFFGSLTFGGYDTSRFEPNDVSFSFGSDIERDLLVDVRSITSTNSNGSTANLLPQSVLALIDSTVSPIYLPQAACDVFAETFGLTYNSTFKLYLIDDEIHKKMVASNPNITFTLGDQSSGGSTVDIVFPYSSFDLKAVFPRVSDVNWYFPLQPADNDTQYTLGRVFLQEAYIMTNYEHGNFSVAQAKFDNSTKSNIVPLPGRKSTTTTNPVTESSMAASPPTNSSHGSLSRGAKIGIATGVAVGAVSMLLVFALFFWRWRQSKRRRPEPTVDKSQIQYVFEKQELDGAAFIRPWPVYLDEKKEDLTNIEVQELPDEPLVEMMTSPQKKQNSRKSGTRMSRSRSYTAYINVKKAKENRMSNGKVSPPLSKFCSLTCAPFGDRFIDLNRSLPPTPIATPMARSPRVSGTSSPMPKNRRMLWQTRPHSNTLVVPREMI